MTGWLGPLPVDALDGIGLRQAAVLREGATASAHRAAMDGATTDPDHQVDHDPRPHRPHPDHGWLARCGVLPPGASTRPSSVRYMATINEVPAALTELRSDLEIHAWQPDEHEHDLATTMRAEG
ncbi:hypothetical protein ACFW93_20995 [Streptomyces canus]|uniref:hypothetical protein n=1 Tax=Streptomyces canus TaxID=58343 RepID=UPI0036A7491C